MEEAEIRELLLKFRNLSFRLQPHKQQLKARLGLAGDLLGENTLKHTSSALNVFLGVGVTSSACPSHTFPLVPIMALSSIPVPSHQLCSLVLPPACSITGTEQAVL